MMLLGLLPLFLLDSTTVVAVIDSATAHGWIAPWIERLTWLPPQLRLVLVGALAALAVDLIQKVLVKLMDTPGIGPVVRFILNLWTRFPRVFGVGGSMAVGGLVAGLPGAVITGLVGGGLRAAVRKGNVMLNTTDKATLAAMKNAMALLLVMGFAALVPTATLAARIPTTAPAPPASTSPEVSKLALERFHFSAFAGVMWDNPTRLEFRESPPRPWAGPRVAYQWSNRLQLQTTLKFSLLDHVRTKQLEVALGLLIR